MMARGRILPLLLLAALVPTSTYCQEGDGDGHDDVPVDRASSALHPLGLYGPFEDAPAADREYGEVGVGGGAGRSTKQRWCSPRRIHLSLGDDGVDGVGGGGESSMTVSFGLPYHRAACHPGRVRVGVVYAPSRPTTTGGGGGGGETIRSKTATATATPSDVRWYNYTSPYTGSYYESDWLYHVQLQGLEHGTEYRYRIVVQAVGSGGDDDGGGDGGGGGVVGEILTAAVQRRRLTSGGAATATEVGNSPVLSFVTSPPPGSDSAAPPTKVILIGDLGQTYNSTRTILNMWRETQKQKDLHHGIAPLSSSKEEEGEEASNPASLIVCAGDMSYADTVQKRWDNWFDLMEPLISRTPIQVSAGNHEIECDGLTRNVFVPYENRFRMPNPTGPAVSDPIRPDQINRKWGCGTQSVFRGTYDGGNAYYAFAYGQIKFVVLGPFSDTSVGSRQYRWLVDVLGGVDRAVTPWLVVVMHVQFYTTFDSHVNESQTNVMRGSMEPLFVRFGVNLVVSGHDHAYLRTKPMRFGRSDPTGKSPVYVIVGEGGNREQHVKGYQHPEPEEWVVRRDRTEYGFATLEAVNATWARWRWVRDGTATEGGEGVTDEAWLANQYFL